jgi:hypothetical protein
VADLSKYIYGLRQHVEALEAAVLGGSSTDSSLKTSASTA